MNFVTPNSAGFAEAEFTEVGWTDAARAASIIARKARSLGRRAARIAVRRKVPTKVPKLDLWPSSRKTAPYRSFENGRMVRLHGAPVNFGR